MRKPAKVACAEGSLLAHDHSELDELLAGFFSALTRGELEQSFAKLDRFWARLAMHIRAEHLHLFPVLLRALGSGRPAQTINCQTVRSTISRLQEDHDYFMRELAAAVQQLRELRPSEPESGVLGRVREQVEGVGRRLETHNELEEKQVYPLADFLLAPADRIVLNERMQRELDHFPARFDSKEE